MGAELLEYLLSGKLPAFDKARLSTSTALLFADLQRQLDNTVKLETNVQLKGMSGKSLSVPILATRVDGKRFAIALSAPLTAAHPADAELLDLPSDPALILKNELVIRGNLAAATREVQQEMAGQRGS